MNDAECLFVLTHELLHAGLNHASRLRGRDPFLWNAACVFVINDWLMEIGIGQPPTLGGWRGTLPAGLIEEIRSLAQPPIPWDVRLAYWFDERFPPPERRRS